MRRLAVSTFAVLYLVMILGITINRTYAWASKSRETCQRGPCHPAAINKPQETTVHQPQTRTIDDQFVAELSLASSEIELDSDAQLYEWLSPGIAVRDGRRIPSRSPPLS